MQMSEMRSGRQGVSSSAVVLSIIVESVGAETPAIDQQAYLSAKSMGFPGQLKTKCMTLRPLSIGCICDAASEALASAFRPWT